MLCTVLAGLIHVRGLIWEGRAPPLFSLSSWWALAWARSRGGSVPWCEVQGLLRLGLGTHPQGHEAGTDPRVGEIDSTSR